MFSSFWQILMASKSAKIGGGIVAGGGTLALLLTSMGARLDDLNHKIDDKDKSIREYVDFKHDMVLREMQFLNTTQIEMKEMLKAINERMYAERNQRKENKE